MNEMTLPVLIQCVQDLLQRPYCLSARQNKGNSVSVMFFDKLACRLLSNSAGMHIEFSSDLFDDDLTPSSFGLTFKAMSSGFVRFLLHSPDQISLFSNLLNGIWEDSAQSVYKFGCCHAFVQCSDQKKCIHEGEESEWGRTCWGCMYHWNLLAGRIFYGKNKNIGDSEEVHS